MESQCGKWGRKGSRFIDIHGL